MNIDTMPTENLVHKVALHVEHDPSLKAVKLVCADHYLTAEACNMIDADYGLTNGACFFCS